MYTCSSCHHTTQYSFDIIIFIDIDNTQYNYCNNCIDDIDFDIDDYTECDNCLCYVYDTKIAHRCLTKLCTNCTKGLDQCATCKEKLCKYCIRYTSGHQQKQISCYCQKINKFCYTCNEDNNEICQQCTKKKIHINEYSTCCECIVKNSLLEKVCKNVTNLIISY
jgi:hypothetical protein